MMQCIQRLNGIDSEAGEKDINIMIYFLAVMTVEKFIGKARITKKCKRLWKM